MVARLREAMSDLAETIRRVFQPPPTHPVAVAVPVRAPGRMPVLGAAAVAPFVPCAASSAAAALLPAAPSRQEEVGWTARVAGESGLAAWTAGVRTGVLALFRPSQTSRMEVPALPRGAAVRRLAPDPFSGRGRSGWRGLQVPAVRTGSGPLAPPRALQGLDRVLGLPLAVRPENLDRLSKAVLMRYNLQLVRSTGENIRNLEVMGLYRIPSRGTRPVRFDSTTGRLLVAMSAEAAGAPRSPFILARRRSDGTVVCSFVEDP
jgi:hypothetical protein